MLLCGVTTYRASCATPQIPARASRSATVTSRPSTNRSRRGCEAGDVVVRVCINAWQGKAECAALFRRAFQPQYAALSFDQLPRDRQPQPDAALRRVNALGPARETCKQTVIQL